MIILDADATKAWGMVANRIIYPCIASFHGIHPKRCQLAVGSYGSLFIERVANDSEMSLNDNIFYCLKQLLAEEWNVVRRGWYTKYSKELKQADDRNIAASEVD